MALRRVDSARLVHTPNIFGKGPFLLVIGRRSSGVGLKRKWSRAEVDELLRYTANWPVHVATLAGKNYWAHADRVYSDTDDLTRDEVWALLVTRTQRERRRVDRAVAIAYQAVAPAQPSRGHIPDDVRQLVWTRDRGACRGCGANTELQ